MSALCTSWAILFFQCRILFSQVYSCKLFPLEISLQDTFFLKSRPPQKSNCRPLKSTRYRLWFVNHFQSLMKQQERKLSSGERRNSFLLTSTQRVHMDVRRDVGTYGDVITKFFRMDSLPNFLRYRAPRLRAPTLRYHNYTYGIFYIPANFAFNLPHYVTSYMHHTGKKKREKKKKKK